MRKRFGLGVFGVVAVLTTLIAGQASHGQAQKGMPTGPCSPANLPAEIQNKLTTKYAGWKIVTPDLLSSENRRYWLKDHPKDCPGLVTGTFSDDNQVGYVLNLISRRKGEQVLYFHPSRDGFSVEILEPMDPTVAALPLEAHLSIEKLAPGKYEAAIKTDSVMVTWLESSGTETFYWKHGRRHVIQDEP
jgi:hypothetical protein